MGSGPFRDLLDPAETYRVRCVTDDKSKVVGTVKVERAELDALEPGAVLTGSTYPTAVGGSTGAQASATTTTAAPQSDASTGRDDDVVPAQEFWDTADEFCGDG